MRYQKSLFSITFLLCISTIFLSQSCEEEFGFQMRTQEDIDNFSINYPGCTELLSTLNIAYDNSGITNLQGLAGIEIVQGDLVIRGQEELLDLSPLDNIHTVNGYLYILESGVEEVSLNKLEKIEAGISIQGNPELKMINGLRMVDSLGKLFHINENERLEKILGFDSLKFVGGGLRIFNNDLLQEIGGFNNLKEIAEKLTFADNIDLKVLSGFEKLESIGDEFIFRGNVASIELSGFNALKTVRGPFRIRDNFGLESVSGFQQLDSIGQIYEVVNNPQLETITGFNSVKAVGDNLYFYENKSLKSIVGFNEIKEIGNRLQISENDSLEIVDGFRKLERIAGGFVLLENFQLEEFIPVYSLQEIGAITQIRSNLKIRNLDGFSSLRSIDGRLQIERNDNLLHLDGLRNLEKLNGGLTISINAALNNIRGVANIDPRTISDDLTNDLSIRFNPNLTYCAYKSVCDLLLIPDSNYRIGPNGAGCNTEEELLCVDRGILGNIYYDENENGIRDINEFGVPNQTIQILPDGDRVMSYIDGSYSIFLEFDKPYEISWEQDPEWRLTTGNTVETITLTQDMLDNDRFDFGIARVDDYMGGQTHLAQEQLLCNDTSVVELIAQNLSTDFLTGRLEMIYDPLFEYDSAIPVPDEIDLVNRILTWNFNSLHPFEIFDVDLRLQNPSEMFLGASVENETRIYGEVDNETELLNEYVFADLIRCAYDPNDKLVNPVGEDEEGQVLPGTSLDYTVRFQNTGNAPARNVSILDTIDAKLDMETFQVTQSSFEVQTVVRENIVEFRFNDINLIDSIANEPESHGFVSFSIDPLPGLPDPSVVENRAHIFFDQNPAIITNTARTTFATPMINEVHTFQNSDAIYLYPNPSQDKIYFGLENDLSLNLNCFEIRTLSGQLLLRKHLYEAQSRYEVDLKEIAKGLYFLILNTTEGNYVSRFFKM